MGVDTVQPPSSSKSRAKLLFRGRQRKMIKKLLFYGLAVQRQDEVSYRRGVAHDTTGPQWIGSRGSADDKALKRVLARCLEALESKG